MAWWWYNWPCVVFFFFLGLFHHQPLCTIIILWYKSEWLLSGTIIGTDWLPSNNRELPKNVHSFWLTMSTNYQAKRDEVLLAEQPAAEIDRILFNSAHSLYQIPVPTPPAASAIPSPQSNTTSSSSPMVAFCCCCKLYLLNRAHNTSLARSSDQIRGTGMKNTSRWRLVIMVSFIQHWMMNKKKPILSLSCR